MCVEAAPPIICRLLWSYGMTRKLIHLVALQRCESLHGAFIAQCSLFDSDMFVGWMKQSRFRGQSAIAAIASAGLLALVYSLTFAQVPYPQHDAI